MSAKWEDTAAEWFRQNPQARYWDSSYTRTVVEGLEKAKKTYQLYGMHTGAVQSAITLLQGFWRDLHLPYSQRDEARAERDRYRAAFERLSATHMSLGRYAKELREENQMFCKLLESLTQEVEALIATANTPPQTAQAAVQPGPEPTAVQTAASNSVDSAKKDSAIPEGAVPLFACKHHPIAVENLVFSVTQCEHGCKTRDAGYAFKLSL